jgi:hypothetical protein
VLAAGARAQARGESWRRTAGEERDPRGRGHNPEDKDIQKGDRKKVIALIEAKVLPHFNFQAMTASAVGRNWDKASAEQKARVMDEFKTLLVRTYSSALASYSSQNFDFRPLRAKPTDTDCHGERAHPAVRATSR